MNLSKEKQLWKKGYVVVAGIDEAGRGPLAGPVVAAAVIINPKPKSQSSGLRHDTKNLLKEVKDSKKLSPQKREKLYELLTNNSNIKWGAGIVSEKVIDRINILEATKLAMLKAISNLKKKNGSTKINHLILDGNFRIYTSIPQISIKQGDAKIFSCAAASIVAKVTRDRLMKKYHKKYPQYGFDKHKGYPTKLHRKMIQECGVCRIHRSSFKLI